MIAAFDELCAEPCWVAWRNEMRNGKPNKTPYSPVDGRLAKANDPRTWGTRSSADARAKNIMRNGMGGGTGLEFHDRGDGTALGGIDLDTCRSEDGTIEPWAQEIIDQFASYTEISPSDTGAKIFFKYRAADYPQLWVAIGKKHGRSFKRGTGEHPPAIELHISNRYYAVTERWLESTPDKLVLIETKLLLWLIHEAGPAFVGNGKEHISSLDDRLSSRPRSTDNSRSAVAYCKGTALRAAGLNFEQMCDALRTDPEISEWCREKGNANGARELRRIWDKGESPKQERKEDFDAAPRKEEAEAEDFDAAPAPAEGVSYADFFALMPMHSYIYTPSREMWPGSSVNARLPAIPLGDGKFMSASLWLDRNRPVEQMTWAPGLPMVIKDRLISQGGWIERNGVSCFNLYRPPAIKHGDKTQAEIWLDHGRTIFPDDIDHIVRWLAHRVQRPEEKINHAIVLGGSQGVGKDSLLEPVKRAVGAWNFSEVSPQQLLGRFNGFAKSER